MMTDSPAETKTAARLRKNSWVRRAARIAVGLALFAYFAFALLFLGLRYLVLPQIETYRGAIERMLSSGISLPVSIEHIDAEWSGLQPNLALLGFVVRDGEGRPALELSRVDAEISWRSLLTLGLQLERLEIAAPTLNIRRDAAGRIFVAGLPLAPQHEQGGFGDWLLAQSRVVVRDATVTWQDEQRGAPALTLSKMNF